MKKIVLLSLSVFAAFSLSAQQPRDWAQYGRYERQNAALAGEPVEVVFMGNSITDNWIGADPDFFARNGFVDRVSAARRPPRCSRVSAATSST
jgi:hypothetical protein